MEGTGCAGTQQPLCSSGGRYFITDAGWMCDSTVYRTAQQCGAGTAELVGTDTHQTKQDKRLGLFVMILLCVHAPGLLWLYTASSS